MVITIKDNVVKVKQKELGVPEFCKLIAQNTVSGLSKHPLPDGVRWLVECDDFAIYIIELQPELRQVLWNDGFSDHYNDDGDFVEGDGEIRTIATPYVIVKAIFKGNYLSLADVYYRNEPLKSLNDKLYLTNLRNIYTFASHCLGDLCLDGLEVTKGMSRERVLGELINHLWTGEFNRELGGRFEEFAKKGDKRLSSIEAWEEASKADPKFVLGVKWFNTGLTVRDIVNYWYCYSKPCLDSSKHLGNLILAAK